MNAIRKRKDWYLGLYTSNKNEPYINIDTELLFQSLSFCNWSPDRKLYWKRWEPSGGKIIDLFKDHICTEFMEYFYDYEPEYDDDIDIDRLSYCNWQEPHYPGSWGRTQKQIDSLAKKELRRVEKSEIPHQDRFWILNIPVEAIPKDLESWNGSTITNDVVMIYYYGRDYAGVDYLWSMEKKNSGQSNEADERLYYEDLTDEKQWYYDAVVSCLILRGMTRKKALEIAKAYNLRDRLDKYDNLQMHYDVEVVADEVILYSNTRRGSVKKD